MMEFYMKVNRKNWLSGDGDGDLIDTTMQEGMTLYATK